MNRFYDISWDSGMIGSVGKSDPGKQGFGRGIIFCIFL